MKQFLGNDFNKSFLQALLTANKSILIISPYVTKTAVQKLLDNLSETKKQKLFITLPPGPDYLTGAVELEALQLLHKAGFEIRCLEDLHAKIYILDQEIAFIGSANFTSNGWNIEKNKGNIEDMVRLTISTEDLSHIYSRYKRFSKLLDPFGDSVKDLEAGYSLLKQYEQFQKKLMDFSRAFQIQKSPIENVKMYSRYFPAIKEYPYNFRFALALSTGKQAKEEMKDFTFELGGIPDKADASITIPFGTMKRILTGNHLDGANKSWQFQISIDQNGKIFLRSSKKDKNHEIIRLKQKLIGTLKKITIGGSQR
ncbi:phospholipase D-like domain-containing protein [Neobacillus drentensis]|uniref:phospholipase D family protein n=1 Tax=Neobacillus drentensis TaxID=220684 RepID=UPI002FFDFAFE